MTMEMAQSAALEGWGCAGQVHELPGDRDRNFKVGDGQHAIVLTVTDAPASEIALSAAALERLAGTGGALRVGMARETRGGGLWSSIQGADGREHRVWAVDWVEGVPLAQAGPKSLELVRELGAELGLARLALDKWWLIAQRGSCGEHNLITY